MGAETIATCTSKECLKGYHERKKELIATQNTSANFEYFTGEDNDQVLSKTRCSVRCCLSHKRIPHSNYDPLRREGKIDPFEKACAVEPSVLLVFVDGVHRFPRTQRYIHEPKHHHNH